jgi:hypothetical protein
MNAVDKGCVTRFFFSIGHGHTPNSGVAWAKQSFVALQKQ